MANALTAANIEVWSRDMQLKMYKDLMALALCNYDFQSALKRGDTFHKPYSSDFHVVGYTKGTDISNRQDATVTDENGTVDQVDCVPIYLDDVDDIQNNYGLRQKLAEDMQEDLDRRLDAVILGEYAVAASDVDDADFGGTSGNPHAYTTSDIDKMLTVAGKKLNLLNVKQDKRFVVVGPSQLQLWQDMLSAKDTAFGDKVGEFGKVGQRFGFEIYVSNNLTFTARWTPADMPSNGATITIAGVTITFTTSTPASAGEVLAETSTAVTLDNLVALLNNSASAAANSLASTSKYFNFTQANLAKLDNLIATDGTTYLDIEGEGMGEVVVATSESLDPWSRQTLHCLAGRKGATSMVLQKKPSVKVVADPDRLGDNLTAWMLYGFKTFTGQDTKALVDINVAASAFTANSAA